MKIDDSALSSYIVENLQPLTKADPYLLANYVAALLKNNKPKEELETLCVDKLLDFVGDESQPFVKKLFCAFEDETILTYDAEYETTVADIATMVPVSRGAKIVGKAMCSGDHTDSRNLAHPSYADTGMLNDPQEEGTDDKDDDRNHKHGRQVSRAHSFDGDMQDCSFKKVIQTAVNGHLMHDTDHINGDNQGSPSNVSQGGLLRGLSFFRGDGGFEHQSSLSQEVLGRGSGRLEKPWGVCEQRTALDGLDSNLQLLTVGPPFVPYSSRASLSKGNMSQSHWADVSQFPGNSHCSLDQTSLLNGVMQGTKELSTNGASELYSRCSDFEERGYCLRGDSCPMEHGANRIVVEDVQCLSQFNLSLIPPSGRAMTLSSMSTFTPAFSPYSTKLSITARDSEFPVASKGISTDNAFLEPDVYDPDQPFLNREKPAVLVPGLKRLPSFRKDLEDIGEEAKELKRRRRQSPNEGKFESSLANVLPQGLTLGQSVFDHVVIHQGDDNAESSSWPRSSFLNQSKTHKREFVKNCEPQIMAGMHKNHFNEKQEGLVKTSSTNVDVNSFFQKEDRLLYTEKINHMSGSKRSTGPGNERAQRTLYVSCIPSGNNREKLLRVHFLKFGEVVDIRVPSQGDRAFVQFSRREDAEAALKSPEAVLGNRFVRLSWAKRDSLPILSAGALDLVKPSVTKCIMSGKLGDSGLLSELSLMKRKHQAVTVSAASESIAFKTAGKVSTLSVASVSLTALPKKQEELELMKEELRRKQDELAQKRDDFRRKLDRLTKQGSGAATQLHENQGINLSRSDAKADTRGNQSSNKHLILETLEAGLDNSQREISTLSSSTEKALLSTDQSTSGLSTDSVKVSLDLAQASTWSSSPLCQGGSRGHSPWPGGTGLPLQRGSMCYKLDNRATAFCVLPPFPDGLSDVTSLKDHFSLFGGLSNVEIEDMDKKVQCFKVTFHTRSAAEQAFLQGQSYQGALLFFSWVPSSGITEGTSSTGNVQVDSIKDN